MEESQQDKNVQSELKNGTCEEHIDSVIVVRQDVDFHHWTFVLVDEGPAVHPVVVLFGFWHPEFALRQRSVKKDCDNKRIDEEADGQILHHGVAEL